MHTRPALSRSALLAAIFFMAAPALAADARTGQATAKDAAQPQGKAARPAGRAPAATGRTQPTRPAGSYDSEIATIAAQAEAAEAACASQPGDASRQACRDAVQADRARAAQAVKSRHAQPAR